MQLSFLLYVSQALLHHWKERQFPRLLWGRQSAMKGFTLAKMVMALLFRLHGHLQVPSDLKV